MHRQPLLRLLDAYAGLYPDESPVVDRVRHLVRKNEDCFHRTCRPGHITGSAWVLSADQRRCLLVHHRKLNLWVQPGGHADGDPDSLAVATREAQEESGIEALAPLAQPGETVVPLDIDVHLIPERRGPSGELIEDAHEHHDIRFLLAAEYEAPIVVSAESHDVRWFTPDEVRRLTGEESVLRLLRKSLSWMPAGVT